MDDGPATPSDVPLESTARVPVEWLVLDSENPRLGTFDAGSDETKLVAQLYRAEDLGELLQSFAANGYIDIEPLIVLERDGRLVVLEGNRRLAALRLFREPDLKRRIEEKEGLNIQLPEISDERRRTLEHVSVYRVADRGDARSFIGFKHINGAARWGSYAKARFAAQWYRAGGVSLEDVARRIGDRHDTVKRMVNAIYVLEQAEGAGIFRMDERATPRFNFSHLYTALSRPPYREFLGLETSWSRYDPEPNPVPETHLGQLREILLWLYGSREEGVEPVVLSQNPHIKQLGEVLSCGEGLVVLRETGRLADAHAGTQPAGRKFSEALIRSRSDIREASNNLRGFDGQESALVDIAEDVSETAQSIFERMKRKMRDAAPDAA